MSLNEHHFRESSVGSSDQLNIASTGDNIPPTYLKDIVPNLRDQEKATLVEKAASTARAGAVLGPWLIRHREAVAKPIVDGFIKAVREDPATWVSGIIAATRFSNDLFA